MEILREKVPKLKKLDDAVVCNVFSIPARSPDLNPIENLFNVVGSKLSSDALEMKIKRENFEGFSARVKRIIEDYPVELIDRTINSMPNRIKLVKRGNGHRTKY